MRLRLKLKFIFNTTLQVFLKCLRMFPFAIVFDAAKLAKEFFVLMKEESL